MTTPENAEALARIARELGAKVIRGPVRQQGDEGGFEVGEVDIGDLLHGLKDQEAIVIIASLGLTQESPIVCHLCGTQHEGVECPTCRAQGDKAERIVEDTLRCVERRKTD